MLLLHFSIAFSRWRSRGNEKCKGKQKMTGNGHLPGSGNIEGGRTEHNKHLLLAKTWPQKLTIADVVIGSAESARRSAELLHIILLAATFPVSSPSITAGVSIETRYKTMPRLCLGYLSPLHSAQLNWRYKRLQPFPSIKNCIHYH